MQIIKEVAHIHFSKLRSLNLAGNNLMSIEDIGKLLAPALKRLFVCRLLVT